MPLTPLTEDARASAREKAVLARAHRQEIKRALSDRELSVRQVLDMVDSDPALAKMPVGQMLALNASLKNFILHRLAALAALVYTSVARWWSTSTVIRGI